MKKSFLLTFLFFPIFLIHSQNYNRFIESQYKKQTYLESSNELSQNYVFIGLYKLALMEEEKDDHIYNYVFSPQLANIKSTNAYPYIYKAIKTNKIVILNEAHNIPLNRVMLYTIIDSFAKFHVDGLFIEALPYTQNDSISHKKSPLEDGGFFIGESTFRQVMFKLKSANIPVYSYEILFNDLDTATFQGKKYIVSKKDSTWTPILADEYILSFFLSKEDEASREAEQALKIYQKMKRNKIQKAVVFCGYGHSWRQEGSMITILEYLLKEKVFSIEQTLLNERVNKKLEDPVYSKFATNNVPFVVVDSLGNPVHRACMDDYSVCSDKWVDMVIGSPKTVYVHNRPTWLELNGDRKRYKLNDFVDVSPYTDFLVAIYNKNELTKVKKEYTPDDVFQVLDNTTNYDLILSPNKEYQLVIIKDGKTLISKTINTNEHIKGNN